MVLTEVAGFCVLIGGTLTDRVGESLLVLLPDGLEVLELLPKDKET